MTITLREVSDGDADAFFEWMRDPESARMAAFTRADQDDREAFDRWLERNFAAPGVLNRAIEEDGVLVGSIATFSLEGDRELTYWIDRARWGRGIASAAVEAILQLDPTRPLRAQAASANLGSIAVLRRNGFTEVGRDTGFAHGVGAEVEVTIFELA